MKRRRIKRKNNAADWGQTSNESAGTMNAKTLPIKTLVLNLKPRRYQQSGKV